MSNRIIAVTRKELASYFSSPVAFIFLGTFLFVSLFIFFWVESFFSRNITDVRPLFEWMPVLLIFLVSSLTMRQWSEERRSGTLEFLLTVPVEIRELVLGKFLACVGLVSVALLLTMFVPISVSIMGNLDWGPVVGAYLAAILVAGAYTAIGLFVSARSESQIVSLIVSILVCLALYMVGSSTFASLVGNFWGEMLSLVGTGSRFESINRGMIDIRDLYYYASIIGVFLVLNIFSLEKVKWATQGVKKQHSLLKTATVLLALNFIIANFWLQKTNLVRVDLTAGNQYTISAATEDVINQLREPLLIRGYFSAKTHPLLAPLVPQVRDLIREYKIVGTGRVNAEFIDPRDNPELEEEANRKFNIKPVPFQISDRYQAALVNSYFNILVQYGDKFEVLSFKDLIEVKPKGEQGIDVQLRNLEYDLTRAIKKVLYGFRTTDSLLASLQSPVKFTGYISPKIELPEKLAEFAGGVETVLDEVSSTSDGKFTYTIVDPRAEDGMVDTIDKTYGFRPMVTGLFDTNSFYFYMILEHDGEVIPIALPENLSAEGAKQSIEAALKRFSPGFLKTVGLVTPPVQAQNPMMMQAGLSGRQFNFVEQKLSQNHSTTAVDLELGTVPHSVDLLLLLAPENLSERAVFAVDQFLMRGGTVLLSTAPVGVTRTQSDLKAEIHTSGLEDWLQQYGVTMEQKIVQDVQNEPYPVPVRRNLGGFTVEEIQLVDYPPYVDIRGDGLAEHGITAGLQQVTLNWPVPLVVEAPEGLTATPLLRSSDKSWATGDLVVQPDFKTYPRLGFPIVGEQKSFPLAVLLQGKFPSYFKGKDSPLLKQEAPEGEDAEAEPEQETYASIIEHSTGAGRLLIFASNEFLVDTTLQISAGSGTERYLNSLGVIENTIDWSLEDPALLTIRARGQFSKTLPPMSDETKMFWEYGNYVFALFGLFIVFLLSRSIRQKAEQRYAGYLNATV